MLYAKLYDSCDIMNAQERVVASVICSARPGLTRVLVHIVNIVYITNCTYYKQFYPLNGDS